MGTTATLAQHGSDDDKPAWRLYEELFESGVVYLELRGVSIEELRTRSEAGADVVLRLPIETAKQLGLHANVPPERWDAASKEKKW